MSFLTYRTPLFLRSSLASQSRAFCLTPRRRALSEDDTHRHEDERKGVIDDHKSDSLNKQKDGKGHWKKDLASNSEAAIKADRGEIDASEETIKKLQKETEEMAKKSR